MSSSNGPGDLTARRATTRLEGQIALLKTPTAQLEDFEQYAPTIERWEVIHGYPVPAPLAVSPRGGMRLSARFVEWMMGLPPGYVTDVDIPNTAKFRILGNGVVPVQAREAYRQLLSRKDV